MIEEIEERTLKMLRHVMDLKTEGNQGEQREAEEYRKAKAATCK